jgi:hypothetical protein
LAPTLFVELWHVQHNRVISWANHPVVQSVMGIPHPRAAAVAATLWHTAQSPDNAFTSVPDGMECGPRAAPAIEGTMIRRQRITAKYLNRFPWEKTFMKSCK